MARTNTKAVEEKAFTHEGGRADSRTPAVKQLERQVATCLLWEDTFYESGSTIAEEIAELCERVPVEEIAALARRARDDFKLRHVPLFLLAQLNKRRDERPGLLRRTAAAVVQRPDELGEALAILSKVEGEKSLKKILSHGLAKGLAEAFTKFSPYQLAKWNRDEAIKLKDVLFLTHAKPRNQDQAKTWKALVDGKLETPDTWEVALSAGADKKATWTRLIEEKKLGGMATLMNLRNMTQAGVPKKLIRQAIEQADFSKILPFRYVAAADACPDMEDALSDAMVRGLAQERKLAGRTLLVVDTSGSMGGMLSAKSKMSRADAALALAMLVREVTEEADIYLTAGNDGAQRHATGKIPPRHGFALRAAANEERRKLGGGGIFLAQAMDFIASKESYPYDRVLVFTDEQDCDCSSNRSPDRAKLLGKRNYIINVASYKPGLKLDGKWARVNGFSERILDWVRYYEEDLTFSD